MKKSDCLGLSVHRSPWCLSGECTRHRKECRATSTEGSALLWETEGCRDWEMKWKDLKNNNKNKFVLKHCSGRFFFPSHSCLIDSHIETRQNDCAMQLF